MLMDDGGAPWSSGLFRVMQRPELVQWKKVDNGGGALVALASKGRKEEEAATGGKSENGGPLLSL